MRIFSASLKFTLCLISTNAFAQTPCESASIIALRTELMVNSLKCGTISQYNTFIIRNRPVLANAEKNTIGDFRKSSKGIQGYDTWITELSNERSNYPVIEGDNYCSKADDLFKETNSFKPVQPLVKIALKQNIFYSPTPSCSVNKLTTSVAFLSHSNNKINFPDISTSQSETTKR